MKSKTLLIVGLALIALALVLVACQSATPTTAPTAPTAEPVTCPTCPEPTACPECPKPLVEDVPNAEAWAASGHNNVTGEQFRHWDGDDPAEVPTSCAKCHTSGGFADFLGADGSAAGTVDATVPAAQAQGISCVACHNDTAEALTSVTFPSGKVVETSEEGEGLCMQCHQGRESKTSVDKQINETFKVTDVDAVVAPIKDDKGNDVRFGFRNVHYFAAGGTLYGSQAQMGYEYEGKTYDMKFRHVDGVDTCVACHDQHSTTIRLEKCQECHTDVKAVEDLKNVRMNGSLEDYNGNGDVKEGISAELAGLQETLYSSIQMYAKEVAGTGIVYDPAANPYFFADADGDGKPDQADGANVRYATWTARLLKAAFNYQVSVKDPGAFAHNSKYIIELLYDSIEDLNGKISTPVDMAKLARIDAGHFAGSTMPFRDWDDAGEVPFGCAKCHSATGLPEFIHNGGTLALAGTTLTVSGIGNQPTANGFMCTTCHDSANFPALYAVTTVPFPSGAKLTFSTEKDDKGNLVPVNANLCLECHQGRESTNSVNNALKAFVAKPDEVALKDDGTPALSFRNIHYLGAGATLFGTEAKGAYEFDGQTYLGKHPHVEAGFNCSSCHDVHALKVKTETCVGCHPAAKDGLDKIRMGTTDYDGDGDTTEGMEGELATVVEKLHAAMASYATAKAGVGIVYDENAYPYWYEDKDGDGKADVDDKGAAIRYTTWTPNLLRAAYNIQYYHKDPGAFAHNGKYVLQVLYDSIKVVGGDVTGMTRP